MFDFNLMLPSSGHLYTVAAVGCDLKSKAFNTRQLAKSYMYNYIDHKGLQVKDKWHDGHYVTYVFGNNVKIFINRF